MEWRVVHDDQAVWPQGWEQHLFDPSGDGQMRTTGLKQHWRQPVRPALRHDQVATAVVFTTDASEDLPAADGPAMRAVGVAGKSALVKIDHVVSAMFGDPQTQRAQKRYSFFVMTLSVARRFFLSLSISSKPPRSH